MKELIEFMARAIVDNPEEVQVTEEDGGDHTIFHLKVAEGDMGRVMANRGACQRMRTLSGQAIRRGETS
jgi:predicted RNA-binding protein YlqC (UPF0109 family)